MNRLPLMKTKFRITYEVITEESSLNGDAARRGFLPRTGKIPFNRDNMPKNPVLFTLRDALRIKEETDGGESPIEADSSHLSESSPPRWLTWGTHLSIFTDRRRRAGIRDNVCAVSLSVHFPRELSGASAMRIGRLFGCRGCRK